MRGRVSMKDIFTGGNKSFEVPKVDIKNLNMPEVNMRVSNDTEETKQYLMETHRKKAQYEADLLYTLKSIEKNTANLSEIVGLIQNSNYQQEEMLGILSEIMNIAKASNKEEAENMWQKLMNKITSTVDGVDSITKLIGFGTVIFNQVIGNLDKIIK